MLRHEILFDKSHQPHLHKNVQTYLVSVMVKAELSQDFFDTARKFP